MITKNNLKKYRIWKGLTQEKLSNEIDVSKVTIAQIENNYKYPKYIIRAKICRYFDINQSQMFYLEEEENEKQYLSQCKTR